MPLYEYSCPECAHRFEVLQKMGNGAEGLSCPKCSHRPVGKQFSTFASTSSGSGAGALASGGGCGPSGFT